MTAAPRVAIVIAVALAIVAAGPWPALGALQEIAPEDVNVTDEDVELVDYEIVTMPAVPGVRFALDGAIEATGPDGVATFSVPKAPREEMVLIKDRIEVLDTEIEVGEQVRAAFSKLVGAVSPLAAGFNLSYPVRFTFTDSSGRSVAPERIDALRIKSSLGNVESIPPGETTWLLGTRLAGGLEVKNVFWSIQDVEVQGASVANRAQTKFFPETDRQIDAPLLFFDAEFSITDAFLGFPTGEAILVRAPNGATERIELVDGHASLTQLPRGEYHITVEGGGLTIERPVAISRDQDLTLKLYTWLDVSLVVVALVLFVIVPPLVGLWLRKRHRRRTEGTLSVSDEQQAAPVAMLVHRGPDGRTTYSRAPSPGPSLAGNGKSRLWPSLRGLPGVAKLRNRPVAMVVRRGSNQGTKIVLVPSRQRIVPRKRKR